MDPIKAYAEYAFDQDETYQQGLASILAGNAVDATSSSLEKEDIIRKTRVFYFNKVKGYAITLDEVQAHEEALKSSEAPPARDDPLPAVDNENRVLTFAELKEMIETGNVDNIPNNKVIPAGLNDVLPSESKVQSRRKPWEQTE